MAVSWGARGVFDSSESAPLLRPAHHGIKSQLATNMGKSAAKNKITKSGTCTRMRSEPTLGCFTLQGVPLA